MLFSKNRSLYIHLSSIEGIKLLNRILHLSGIPSNSLSNFMVIMTSSKLLKTSASTSIPPNASLALKNCSIVYKNTSTERVEETTAALPGWTCDLKFESWIFLLMGFFFSCLQWFMNPLLQKFTCSHLCVCVCESERDSFCLKFELCIFVANGIFSHACNDLWIHFNKSSTFL